jgi:hypothetical protein
MTALAPADAATWLLSQVSEAELQTFVVKTARLLGWRVFHPKFSIGSDAGWPDLCAAQPEQRRLVFMELKREGKWPTRTRVVGGRLRQGQSAWLETLVDAGQETYLVWPSDRGDVPELLQHGPRPGMRCLARLLGFLRADA